MLSVRLSGPSVIASAFRFNDKLAKPALSTVKLPLEAPVKSSLESPLKL